MTCAKCTYCRAGYFTFCTKRRAMGHGVNGALTRYVVMRPDQIYRIPDGMSREEAALSEPSAAAVQAVTEVTTVRIGQTALVSGSNRSFMLKLLVADGIKTIVAGVAGDDGR